MNISLTREHEKLIKNKLASGNYICASEVVREALQLLAERDWVTAKRVQELRQQIAQGLAQAKAGQLLDGPTVMAKLGARLREKARQAKRAKPNRR